MQMTGFGKTAVSALTAAGLLLMAAGGGWEQACGLWNESTEAGRMKNVVLLESPSAAPKAARAEDMWASSLRWCSFRWYATLRSSR